MKNSFTELKLDELLAKRGELRKKYFDLRFQLVVGHVENPLEKRNLRRMIARLETRISERGRAGDVPATVISTSAVATKPVSAKPVAGKVAKPAVTKATKPAKVAK